MKRTMILLAVVFLAIAVSLPAFAQDEFPPNPTSSGHCYGEPPGDFILLDVFVLRPLGLAAMGVGAIGAVAATPWAVSSNSEDRVQRELLQKPCWYTLRRPLGDINY